MGQPAQSLTYLKQARFLEMGNFGDLMNVHLDHGILPGVLLFFVNQILRNYTLSAQFLNLFFLIGIVIISFSFLRKFHFSNTFSLFLVFFILSVSFIFLKRLFFYSSIFIDLFLFFVFLLSYEEKDYFLSFLTILMMFNTRYLSFVFVFIIFEIFFFKVKSKKLRITMFILALLNIYLFSVLLKNTNSYKNLSFTQFVDLLFGSPILFYSILYVVFLGVIVIAFKSKKSWKARLSILMFVFPFLFYDIFYLFFKTPAYEWDYLLKSSFSLLFLPHLFYKKKSRMLFFILLGIYILFNVTLLFEKTNENFIDFLKKEHLINEKMREIIRKNNIEKVYIPILDWKFTDGRKYIGVPYIDTYLDTFYNIKVEYPKCSSIEECYFPSLYLNSFLRVNEKNFDMSKYRSYLLDDILILFKAD
ncbi:MAG: hypothetical protein QW524_02835 [Candidatus Woesearchaeota archaeon]